MCRTLSAHFPALLGSWKNSPRKLILTFRKNHPAFLSIYDEYNTIHVHISPCIFRCPECMRRGECCGLKWCDIDWEQRSIHICRNAVKVTDGEIFVKEPKTRAGNRYVYFSAEMESLLREYRQECAYITETYDQRQLTADDFLFRRQGAQLPMTPTTFTYRFKLILKKNGLPQELNVHSLRHTAASLMIAGGTDVATVAGILGHSQPSTTLDIYTHAFDKNKKAASAGLQEMLEI